MEYKASFDSFTKTLTACICILFLGILIFNLKMMFHARLAEDILIHGGVILLLILVFTGCYLFSVNDYAIDGGNLLIRRPVGDKKIPISEISDARKIEQGEMFGTIRIFGNGGLFGYYGKFYNRSLGSMTVYTTQRKNRVLLQMKNGKKIVLSPDDLSILEFLKPKTSASI